MSDHIITKLVDTIVHRAGDTSIQRFCILRVKDATGPQQFQVQRVVYNLDCLKKKRGGVVFTQRKFETQTSAEIYFHETWFELMRVGYRDIEDDDYSGEYRAVRDSDGKLITIAPKALDEVSVVVVDNKGLENFFDVGVTYLVTDVGADGIVSAVGRYGEQHFLSVERVEFQPVTLV